MSPLKLSQRAINCGLVLVLVLMLSFLAFGEWGLLHYWRLSEERRSLEERSQALQRDNELLREKIYRLRKDDRYLEKVARGRARAGKGRRDHLPVPVRRGEEGRRRQRAAEQVGDVRRPHRQIDIISAIK